MEMTKKMKMAAVGAAAVAVVGGGVFAYTGWPAAIQRKR